MLTSSHELYEEKELDRTELCKAGTLVSRSRAILSISLTLLLSLPPRPSLDLPQL